MNSPFAHIFLSIQQLLKEQAPFIKYTDQDLGQLKSQRPPLSWPCCLIDFENFSFESLGENVQQACGSVVFRLVFAPNSNTNSTTPLAFKELALDYYEIENKLHQLLQGWQPCANTGKLNRKSADTQKRTDNYRVRELRYSLSFDDYSTKQELHQKHAELELEETISL